MQKLNYKQCGVDIKKAEDFVAILKKLFPHKQKEKILAFGAFLSLSKTLKKYRNPMLVASCDGVGTKLVLAQTLNTHYSVGIDLVAMNVNDIIALGAKPLFFLDYIACGRLNLGVLEEVMRGVKRGLHLSGCILLGGETAEMPGMYTQNEYDLAGFCVGIVDSNKKIEGKNIKEGDIIIGLASNGLHSNGFSLVRKAFTTSEIKKYRRELLKPTRIYVKPILSLLSTIRGQPSLVVKGVAHITGGAFYNKATKILPQGLTMVIRRERWKVPKIFKLIQEKGGIDDREMYSVFNMGIGMLLVVGRKYQTKIKDFLGKYYKTFLIGEIAKGKEKVRFL